MNFFRRYTNLAATIHILRTKEITLLSPTTWDDRNDAYFMAEYKRYKKAKTVLALCFAERPETYHHWRVFSSGSDGVCIEFDKERLLSSFKKDKRISHGNVEYKKIKELNTLRKINLEKMPLLKRYPYEDEGEYRIIFVDDKLTTEFEDFKIKAAWINRVILSPWMSKGLRNSVRDTLQSIDGCSTVNITRSTLIDNKSWKKATTRVRIAP